MFIQAMTDMNKVMDPQKTAKTMQEFTKQSAKMDMTEEMSKCNFSNDFFADSVCYSVMMRIDILVLRYFLGFIYLHGRFPCCIR